MNNREPGQDRNVAALSELFMCGGFNFMNNDEYFMKIALKNAAKAASFDEVPVGAVIVKEGKIISQGYNKREAKQSVFSHAEIEAIKKANKKLNSWRLEDCTIYVTLEPCIMCSGAIIQSRFKKIVFGALDPKGGAIVSSINVLEAKNINWKPEIVYGVLQEECSEILKKYFKTKRI